VSATFTFVKVTELSTNKTQ